MAEETLAERVAELENRIKEMEERLAVQNSKPMEQRGWRAIVGVHANNPRFEEALPTNWNVPAACRSDYLLQSGIKAGLRPKATRPYLEV
jgi:hypothetical protein